MTLLNGHHPDAARNYLISATRHCARTLGRVGSEHFRQFGICALQGGDGQHAAGEFRKAMAADAATAGVSADANRSLLLSGARHLRFVLGDVSGSHDALVVAEAGHGPDSIIAAVHRSWGIATALAVGTIPAMQLAADWLDDARLTSSDFGHQRTVVVLLAATPGLGLPPAERRAWLVRALHTNGFAKS